MQPSVGKGIRSFWQNNHEIFEEQVPFFGFRAISMEVSKLETTGKLPVTSNDVGFGRRNYGVCFVRCRTCVTYRTFGPPEPHVPYTACNNLR